MGFLRKSLKYILILIIIVLLGVIFNNYREEFENKKRYAICLWGQLRGVKTTKDSFYTNIVEPLQADVFILANKADNSIDNSMDLFERSIVDKKFYDRPSDIKTVYHNYNKLEIKNNYLANSNISLYYNWYKMNEMFGEVLEKNYDYIILTRSDMYYVFPFPDIMSLSNNDNIIWQYSNHSFGGINPNLVCVPSKIIRKYLSMYYEYLQENHIEELNKLDMNIEAYSLLLVQKNNWPIGKIMPNSFISADKLDEITTWGQVKYDEKRNIYYKYEVQVEDAYASLDLYKKNPVWLINDNYIYLSSR